MLRNFLPKDFDFFDLLERQANHTVTAAQFFKDLVSKGPINQVSLQRMRDIEHQSDEVAHSIIEHLNKTFITPFDREDIYTLTKELDDVTDMINTIVNRMVIYHLHNNDKDLIEFAIIIEESVKAIENAVKGLRNAKHSPLVLKSCVEVNRLENLGDTMRDTVLAKLFENGKSDPIFVIKWKEIYEDAETVLDICEDVAHIIESILVKQA